MTSEPARTNSERVLIIDDDPQVIDLASRLLKRAGYDVYSLDTPIGATNLARSLEPDIVLVDINLPGVPGDALLPLIRRAVSSRARILMFSSVDEIELRATASRVGADGCVHKSRLGSSFVRAVRDAIGATVPST